MDLRGIDWVIAGGESGHGARPMREEWVTSIRDQCLAADVKFFFKQWGGVRSIARAGPSMGVSMTSRRARDLGTRSAPGMNRSPRPSEGRDGTCLAATTWPTRIPHTGKAVRSSSTSSTS